MQGMAQAMPSHGNIPKFVRNPVKRPIELSLSQLISSSQLEGHGPQSNAADILKGKCQNADASLLFCSQAEALPRTNAGGSMVVEPGEEETIAGIFTERDSNDLSVSYLRRGLMFMVAVPFVFPQQQLTIANVRLDASDLAIIQNGVKKVLSKSKAAGVLRLVFHDAGTFDVHNNSGGMNGSIVHELDRPENAGLSKVIKILDKVKKEINDIHEVSWADLIAVAGAEAVSLCGGPSIPVQLGRLDARLPDPEGRLPTESLDATVLKRCFQRKGFSTQELVALSGAHTLGGKGFGKPTVFDNAYFKILIQKPWTSSDSMSAMIGLPTDRALVEDDECLRWVTIYADDEQRFFNDFKNGYIKLVNLGAIWREIKK